MPNKKQRLKNMDTAWALQEALRPEALRSPRRCPICNELLNNHFPPACLDVPDWEASAPIWTYGSKPSYVKKQ